MATQDLKRTPDLASYTHLHLIADKPLDFENMRSPANAAPDWLS